ncbi:PrsW family glutamic-type intramembrane protease [Streptomyces sp. NPDC049627]|uniref:PrsW family glutamic-type intramembrane protease n=1 Tax=Streptomyces sp. NPDC049627 TaxID=3365595 RepID=UPI0037BACCF3
MMAMAALWGVLQLFAISWPARSVRLSTVLLALAAGVYGCGVATALIQLAYTRLYAEQSGQSLVMVVNTTSYTVAPWVEELLKATPLLLAGLSLKVRRQWGLTDFVVVGAALGAGFGLLEAVLRFGLDAERLAPSPPRPSSTPASLALPGSSSWGWVPRTGAVSAATACRQSPTEGRQTRSRGRGHGRLATISKDLPGASSCASPIPGTRSRGRAAAWSRNGTAS